jgi:photosystem II stability/assembly factor-like uncharacterized protein
VVLRPTNADLHETAERAVDLTTTDINIKARASGAGTIQREIDKVQFANSRIGWVGTSRSLYRTSDGGNTWEHLALSVPVDSHISSFFFIDETLGWLALVNKSDGGSSSRVIVTRDGGKSWSEQAGFPDGVFIKEIKFSSSTRGLAVGGRRVNASPPYEESFGVSTIDGGKTWRNISDRIKSTTNDPYPRPVSDISWPGPSRVLLLLRGGSVLSSSDGGETWERVVQFEDERPNGSVSSTGYYKIVLDSRARIRVIAGAMGEEGYWGDFLTQGDDESWISFELVRVPILDAIFLSEKEIVASGWEIRAYDEKQVSELPAVGVILRSADGGKSWSAIYRSKLNEKFFSLTKVSDNQFYAVSDGGTLLRFSLKNT